MHSYSLFELNEYIKRVIALNFSEPIWINAEVSQFREARGQVYLELVQHDEESGSVIAQSNAVIWYKSYLFIKNKLGDLTQALLQEGSHIKIKVSVEFNERYGLKLNISDIDPSFTIGQMEMARKKILERLSKEGYLELNQKLKLPPVVQRIAVISSAGAAGYQDFTNQLRSNSFGYRFRIDLYQSAMQGQNVEREVVKSIREINEKDSYDCIAIIRGGGSRLDLSFFDNYNIACEISKNKYPVLSGIGHDIDQSVTDIVAHTSLKTPTAVADFIIEKNLGFESSVIDKGMMVSAMAKQLVNNHKLHLSNLFQILAIKPQELVRRNREIIASLQNELRRTSRDYCRSNVTQLQSIEDFIQLNDPSNILNRGYAMVLKKGKVITSFREVKTDDKLEINMHDGTINTKVL